MASMAERDGKIWLDGEFVDWRDAKVRVLTYTLHYGMGVFEGVGAYETDKNAAIFWRADHSRRLGNSAKIMGMPMPFSDHDVNAAMAKAKGPYFDQVAGKRDDHAEWLTYV